MCYLMLTNSGFDWFAEFSMVLLGALGAILTTVLTSAIYERNKRKRISSKIKEELQAFLAIDKNAKQAEIRKGTTFQFTSINLIELPYVEELKITNELLLLAKCKWFSGFMQFITLIEELKHWCALQTEYFFSHIEKIEANDKVYLLICDEIAALYGQLYDKASLVEACI